MQKKHGRLMIFMPPGSAKSVYISSVAPTWAMGKFPGWKIILASYGSDLAKRHGRRARQIVKQSGYAGIFGTGISALTSAADEWSLDNGGEYLAGGILSGITGNRCNGLHIDDPVKGREEAESEVISQKTWDAYQDDLLTRLIPGGYVIIVQCMTGETPVLMATGEEKPLYDVRPGDMIATYDDGKMSISKVLNWKNNGTDSVYKIRTKSGIIVRANKRHPFLVVKDGEEEWIRLKNLKVGECILRATGVNGEALTALRSDAISRRVAKECVTRITTRSSGPMECARHLLKRILLRESAQNLSIGTALLTMTIRKFSQVKVEFALFANVLQKMPVIRSIGTTFYVLITAMKRKKSEGFYAMTVISQSGEEKRQKSLIPPLNISEFIPDEIVSIEYDGEDEVFDIQVEGTENFIANSLVSHNTRWHENDLAGRILPKHYNGESGMIDCRDGNTWEVINLPAQCERADDPLGRKVGEMLWPEWFDEKHWANFRSNSRTWVSLFQQRPSPAGGTIFKLEWMKERYGTVPDWADLCVHSWDTANKTDEINAPSVCTMWRYGNSGGYHLADLFNRRMDYPTLKRMVISLAERDNPHAILIEDKASGQSLIQDLRSSTSLNIIAIEPKGDKVFRANEVSATVEAGRLILPESSPWLADYESEMLGFPNTAFKDQVDSTTQFLQWVKNHDIKGEILIAAHSQSSQADWEQY